MVFTCISEESNFIFLIPQKIKKLIVAELKDVANKHGQDRKSEIIYIEESDEDEKEKK
jgi:hypothetical protein